MKPLQERFWDRVKKTEGCWEWQKYRDSNGYGEFQFCENKKKGNISAHRYSYFLANPGADETLIVCHKCDNPCCVRPDHLFLGTHQDNVDDKVRKGRQAIAETNGRSKLTWDIVKEIRTTFKNNTSHFAEKYSINSSSIRNVLQGKTWKDKNFVPIKTEALFIKGHTLSQIISTEKVLEIKKLISEGIGPTKISEITGVKNQRIRDIKRGVAYYNITL